jgi:hypothetical protein
VDPDAHGSAVLLLAAGPFFFKESDKIKMEVGEVILCIKGYHLPE